MFGDKNPKNIVRVGNWESCEGRKNYEERLEDLDRKFEAFNCNTWSGSSFCLLKIRNIGCFRLKKQFSKRSKRMLSTDLNKAKSHKKYLV